MDDQNRWNVMVWCGIVNGYLIGPYFFDGNVDRHNYLELLRDHLPEPLEKVDLATRQRMWLRQDCAIKSIKMTGALIDNISIILQVETSQLDSCQIRTKRKKNNKMDNIWNKT